jgi:hypothetical protein
MDAMVRTNLMSRAEQHQLLTLVYWLYKSVDSGETYPPCFEEILNVIMTICSLR